MNQLTPEEKQELNHWRVWVKEGMGLVDAASPIKKLIAIIDKLLRNSNAPPR